MNSIVVKIKNGLGNQMFQYALGRKLSILNNCPLSFDISEYSSDLRNHESIELNIHRFNVVSEIANYSEVERIISKRKFSCKILNYLVFICNRLVGPFFFYKRDYIKDEWNDNMNVLKVKAPSYLEGDWVNMHYFESIEEQLRKELSLKKELENYYYNDLKTQILNTPNSIGIHFRRNYEKLSPANEYFGVLPLTYYYEALTHLKKIINADLSIFVFSDNPIWVADNFITSHNIKILYRSDLLTDAHEFELLKSCKHQIIANSTYSWWAAYLNNNDEKVVIAPKKWYLNYKAQKWYEKGYLTPKEWTLV